MTNVEEMDSLERVLEYKAMYPDAVEIWRETKYIAKLKHGMFELGKSRIIEVMSDEQLLDESRKRCLDS